MLQKNTAKKWYAKQIHDSKPRKTTNRKSTERAVPGNRFADAAKIIFTEKPANMGENLMDIIIVSNGRNGYLRTVTKHGIDTCVMSSSLITFNFIIIEQAKHVVYKIPRVKTMHYDFEFNYNRCLNLGLKHSTTKYVALCNNDLDFRPFWAENIIAAMGNTYLSASPSRYGQRKGIAEGYEIAKQLNGWCIVINRAVLDKIGKLDEGVKFWYSDDIYADQLRAQGIKHILVNHSFVRHLGSRTLRTDRNGRDLMRKQRKNYIEARKKYIKKQKL